MFTKTTKLFAILSVASVIFLSACSNNDEITSNKQALSGTGLAISDPQIKNGNRFYEIKKYHYGKHLSEMVGISEV